MTRHIGFRLHQHRCSLVETEDDQHVIEAGDTVRCRTSRLLLHVIDVDGEHVYCDGFLDPFSASGLEVVS